MHTFKWLRPQDCTTATVASNRTIVHRLEAAVTLAHCVTMLPCYLWSQCFSQLLSFPDVEAPPRWPTAASHSMNSTATAAINLTSPATQFQTIQMRGEELVWRQDQTRVKGLIRWKAQQGYNLFYGKHYFRMAPHTEPSSCFYQVTKLIGSVLRPTAVSEGSGSNTNSLNRILKRWFL